MKAELSSEKIRDLCDVLKQEAVIPARQQASEIIETAKKQAEKILEEARSQSKLLISDANKEVSKIKSTSESALIQSVRQSLSQLRSEIEEKLFNRELQGSISDALANPKLIASTINALIAAIDKEGLAQNIEVFVQKEMDLEALSHYIDERASGLLNKGLILAKDHQAGVRVRLVDEKVTYEMTQEFLTDLLSKYLRPEFRKKFFGE